MADAIATLTGTALVPGVSKNGRLYTKELIGKAVERAKARLADPAGMPLTMRVAHPEPEKAAYAPVTEIAGRITDIWQEGDGSARFKAALSGNTAGENVLKLVDTRSGAPFLKNVSVRGCWVGEARRVAYEGRAVETGDDMELDGLDFTHRPGVAGAEIDSVSGPDGGATESAGTRRAYIYESCEEASVTTAIQETTTDTTTGGEGGTTRAVYADNGYLPDGAFRYPLGTTQQVRAAWHALAESDTARRYTSAQLGRAKGRVKKAAGQHGIHITPEGYTVTTRPLTESEVAEMWCPDDDFCRPSFNVTVDNGAVCVSVYSYRVDAHDLDRIARAAMDGAVNALAGLDPDMDGDIDPPGTVEAAPTQTPASTEDAATTTTESEGSAMADTTPAAEGTAAAPAATAAVTFDPANMAALIGAAVAEASKATATAIVEAQEAARAARKAEKTAATAPVAETAAAPAATDAPAAPAAPAPAAAVTETEDQRVARLVQEQFTKLVQDSVANGGLGVGRKGHVGKQVTESGPLVGLGDGDSELNAHGLPRSWAGDKAAHELKTPQERAHLSATLMQHVVGDRI